MGISPIVVLIRPSIVYTNKLISSSREDQTMLARIKSVVVSTCLLCFFSPYVAAEYVFTAPPRESLEKGIKVYKPISDYLTKVTGETFTYYHPETWTEYSSKMHAETFDLVFDGPHFVDWRINNIGHSVILKLPKIARWALITRKDDLSIATINDMVGRKACAPGSPNFGMLNMMSHFPDPDKQPIHVKVKGWNNVFNAVKSGKCDVGVLPNTNHDIFDKNREFTKSIHKHLPYPNQGMTYGPRISYALAEKIKSALLSDEGQAAMANLRKRYTASKKLIKAENEEYDGVRIVLKRANNFTYEKKKSSAVASK